MLSKKQKNIIKTAVGTVILGMVGSLLATFLLGADIGGFFKFIFTVIYKALIFRIPVWVLLIIIFLAIIAVKLSKRKPLFILFFIY